MSRYMDASPDLRQKRAGCRTATARGDGVLGDSNELCVRHTQAHRHGLETP